MNLLLSALAWIFDPANWVPGSQSPLPIQDRLIEHLIYTGVTIVIAAVIALPLGFYIGHTGKGRQSVIAFTGSMRACPCYAVPRGQPAKLTGRCGRRSSSTGTTAVCAS